MNNKISNSNIKDKIYVTNNKMDITLNCIDGVKIEKWVLKSLNFLESEPCPDQPCSDWEAFVLEIDGIKYPTSVFAVTNIEQVRDKTQELVTVCLEYSKLNMQAKVILLNDLDKTVNFIIQLAVDWPDGYPREVFMHVPFLANFHLQGSDESTFYYPLNPISRKNGQSALSLNSAFRMPLAVLDNNRGYGFSIDFPLLTDHRESSQNRNLDLRDMYNEYFLKNHSLRLRPGRVLTDVIDLEFCAEEGGWPGMYSRLRNKYRKTFNMKEYERDDFEWYKNAFLHHFTYVYGKEAYDYKANKLDIDRLLDQGDEFGGYDVIILWHQYPRLGVDERDQFDFYDDFPGGKEGIREIVRKAHKRGTSVFLPFKPWDIPADESTEEVGHKIASLVRDTDIDGFFLDTMANLPLDFRRLVDQVKPGVVFYSEGQPGSKEVLELLTSSWDQFWNWGAMPDVLHIRFMLPEHISLSIARWHVGDKKDRLIKRAVFNGIGIVIWQDIFGSWLPYSPEQKAEVKRWKELWMENKSCFLSKEPIPLYPTLFDGLYCNMFPSDSGDETIYILYNENDEDVKGSLFINHNPSLKNVSECWNGTKACLVNTDKGAEVVGEVKAQELAIIKAFK